MSEHGACWNGGKVGKEMRLYAFFRPLEQDMLLTQSRMCRPPSVLSDRKKGCCDYQRRLRRTSTRPRQNKSEDNNWAAPASVWNGASPSSDANKLCIHIRARGQRMGRQSGTVRSATHSAERLWPQICQGVPVVYHQIHAMTVSVAANMLLFAGSEPRLKRELQKEIQAVFCRKIIASARVRWADFLWIFPECRMRRPIWSTLRWFSFLIFLRTMPKPRISVPCALFVKRVLSPRPPFFLCPCIFCPFPTWTENDPTCPVSFVYYIYAKRKRGGRTSEHWPSRKRSRW